MEDMGRRFYLGQLAMTGYQPKTTFWDDFTIADAFGVKAVKDTGKRAVAEWKSNVEFMTELVIVLNWKIWFWYDKNSALGKTYNDLWAKADAYCLDTFKGEDLRYYLRTTD